MKQGMIYGGTFLFAFVVVTGLLIYLNSTCENIFKLNFAPKSIVQAPDQTKTDPLIEAEDLKSNQSTDSTQPDSILLSSLADVVASDSLKTVAVDSVKSTKPNENLQLNKVKEITNKINSTTGLTITQPQEDTQISKNEPQGKEYTEWVQKVTSIYASMEPKKVAKIIQTYSDNVARDILYTMSKKTAAKVVSELSPETANRIFRFE
jgi:flagellar motility protein MotE (MotC chaperone)